MARAPFTTLNQIRAARKRIAVTIEVMGKRFHTQSFGVTGSRAALAKTRAACDIPESN